MRHITTQVFKLREVSSKSIFVSSKGKTNKTLYVKYEYPIICILTFYYFMFKRIYTVLNQSQHDIHNITSNEKDSKFQKNHKRPLSTTTLIWVLRSPVCPSKQGSELKNVYRFINLTHESTVNYSVHVSDESKGE